MYKFFFFAIAFLFLNTLTAQCDFPQNNHTTQYDDVIVYNGAVHQRTLGNGTTIFSIDPSQLSFQPDAITGEAFPTSDNGVWLIKWNYAANPNRWQTLPTDCSATSVTFRAISGEPIKKGQLEIDFFYYDEMLDVSATFEGTILYDIEDLGKKSNRLVAAKMLSIY